jgi:RimJ/RimL family protein N-acetyltransferase
MTTFFAPDHFVTPRFILRTYRAGDGEKLADAINSSHDHLSPFLAWGREEHTVEATENRARQNAAKYLKNEDFAIAILAPDESELWGGTGFHLWEGPIHFGNAEISMWIRASQAGKGLGTAVLNAMIEWGFTEWNWTRLAWRNDVANTASQRTAERAGMTFEGILREFFPNPNPEGGAKSDSMYYAILKSEWRKERGAS